MFIGINLKDITITTYILKIFFLTICIYFTFLKIVNINNLSKRDNIKAIVLLTIVSFIVAIFKYEINPFMSTISLIFLISMVCSFITKNSVGYSILISIISASFNYLLFYVSILITFVLNIILKINNDIINLIIMMIFHTIILYRILKIKKLKNGISFFNKKAQDDYFDIIILNISIIILFSNIMFTYMNINGAKDLIVVFIIYAIIMVITINRTLQLYYKHKLLVKELDDTKKELDNAKTEITNLERDNLNISKRDHSLAHKQNILEYKINKLMMNSETTEEIDLKDEVEDLSKKLYDNSITVRLPKTDIQEIDDVLEFVQHDCKENNIDFQVQLIGNIYHMVNEIISKDELQTLISDHVKDAIIAINHCENINRSILVKIGKIDEYYGLYIYDSGIEFKKEVLENLGKKPITTYSNEGGTGIGFINTFEILKKYNASLIIKEIGKPSKENYTKIVIMRFDGENKFEVIK